MHVDQTSRKTKRSKKDNLESNFQLEIQLILLKADVFMNFCINFQLKYSLLLAHRGTLLVHISTARSVASIQERPFDNL